MMFLGPNQWSVPVCYMKLRKGYALLVGLLGLLSITFGSCWAAAIVILCALVMPLVMVCSVRYIKGFARAVWLTNICPFGCDYR